MIDVFSFTTVLVPLAVYALSVPVPGPGLVVISKESVFGGWTNGSAAALGTTLSATIYAAATVVGISALLFALPWLAIAIQIAGGAYLLYLGSRLLKSAMQRGNNVVDPKLARLETKSARASFRDAFLVGLGNAKMIAFFAGLLAPALASDLSVAAKTVVFAGIVLIDFAYHQTLALVVARNRHVIAGFGRAFDMTAGSAMMLFGLQMIFSAFDEPDIRGSATVR